jgi:Fe-S cluster assembly protein SufD
MSATKTRFEAAKTQLGGTEQTAQLSFKTARHAARGRVLSLGLPQKRDEYWRYSDPSPLTSKLPALAHSGASANYGSAYASINALKLVFVDGVFDKSLSDNLVLEGAEISLLEQGAPWADELYGTLEARGQIPVARPLASLNTAIATQGLLVRVFGKCDRPIIITYNSKTDGCDVILHHFIKIEQAGSLTLIENGTLGARGNIVCEVDLDDHTQLHHIRTQGQDHDRHALTHLFARLGNESLLKSFTLTANGRFTRNEAVVEMLGHDAKAHLAGAAMGGTDFHHDDTLFITHSGLRCESRQVFKKVLSGGAVGVFQGKILVKKSAQKTDGYQMSQSLLLDDNSQFLAKPELEIYADDVKCSRY